jgi:hypothetical protein
MYAPKTPLARLYEKTSARGLRYFVGRLGLARLVLLRTPETSDSGEPVWMLSAEEAAAPAKATAPGLPLLPTALSLSRKPRKRRVAPLRRQGQTGAAMADDPVDDLWRGEP